MAAFAEISGGLGDGLDSSVCNYQLVFQRWKTRPGVVVPRTVIVTDDMIFLCDEDHASLNPDTPRLKVGD